MKPDITPLLFNAFCENILQERESRIRAGVKCPCVGLIEYGKQHIYQNYLQLTDLHRLWHIEVCNSDYYLWRRRDWNVHQEHIKQMHKDRIEYENIAEERREVFFKICENICDLLGLDKKTHANTKEIRAIAEKSMQTKSKNAQELLKINLEIIREFPQNKKHSVLDDRGREDYKLLNSMGNYANRSI